MRSSEREVALIELQKERNRKKARLIHSRNAWMGQFHGACGVISSDSNQRKLARAIRVADFLMMKIVVCPELLDKIPENLFQENLSLKKFVEVIRRFLPRKGNKRE